MSVRDDVVGDLARVIDPDAFDVTSPFFRWMGHGRRSANEAARRALSHAAKKRIDAMPWDYRREFT